MEPNNSTIILIFRRASEFLDPSDSFKLLSLNKEFYEQLPKMEWYNNLSIHIFHKIFNVPYKQVFNESLVFSTFSSFSHDTNYEKIYRFVKHSYNLIKDSEEDLQSFFTERHFFSEWRKDIDFPNLGRNMLLIVGCPMKMNVNDISVQLRKTNNSIINEKLITQRRHWIWRGSRMSYFIAKKIVGPTYKTLSIIFSCASSKWMKNFDRNLKGPPFARLFDISAYPDLVLDNLM